MADESDDAKHLEALLSRGTSGNAQANLVRAAKVPEWGRGEDPLPVAYHTRDWTMFYFFRLCEPRNTPDLQDTAEPAKTSPAFRAWLQTIVDERDDSGQAAALALVTAASIAVKQPLMEVAEFSGDDRPPPSPEQVAKDLVEALTSPSLTGPPLKEAIGRLLQEMANGDKERLKALLGGLNPAAYADEPLMLMVLFELVRQAAPTLATQSLAKDDHLRAIRSEASELGRYDNWEKFDRTPINICFTYPGLAALGVNPDTLTSFPDAFRQGMAARSERLRDVGPNAPEHWEGELGLGNIHGYFTGGADLDRGMHVDETFWSALRSDIQAFNNPVDKAGQALRARINTMFKAVGIEVLHVELGQNPYAVAPHHRVDLIRPRKEHFGFRDGLSQPALDLGLDPDWPNDYGTPMGGGTPSPRDTWTPVAPGEIFLDRTDETGKQHRSPCNRMLRTGSTYLVFRKLEQDVMGFRAWLATQRPRPEERYKLAAEIIGRWPNGTSLVQSPDSEQRRDESSLNDFRYAADDPLGRKCPLGAHVRRSNPRDIGDRDNVRHHRILRRGIAYGGRLLGPDEADDGEKRGMLFIAANASIDTQFEVIQGAWINSGEFQGQAGLGRCPLTGTREGRDGTDFLPAGSGVPLLELPQFVTMRGGDYFFVPGMAALLALALGERFAPDSGSQPYAKLSTADAAPRSPFAPDGLRDVATKIMKGVKRVVRVQARSGATPMGPSPAPVAFVARHEDVAALLCNKPHDATVTQFSMGPIREAGLRISRGDEWLVGTDECGDVAPARKRMKTVLERAWKALEASDPDGKGGLQSRLTQVVHDKLDAALRRVAGTRTIDLIDDFAAPAAYAVAADILGLPGPAWLTELAAALPFSQQHAATLPREWIAAVHGEMPSDPRLATLQIWTCLMAADMFGNAQKLVELQVLSRQAGSEMLNHIDLELLKAVARVVELGPSNPPTLVEAFVINALTDPEITRLYPPLRDELPDGWQKRYLREVAIILLEIAASTMAIMPLTFGHVMQRIIGEGLDPTAWTDDDQRDRAICEAERLNPNIPFRLRKCEVDTAFGKDIVRKGDMVMALTAAAGMDCAVFTTPEKFSFGDDGCQRNLHDYLLFGVSKDKDCESTKYCWGKDIVALPVLRECLRMAGRLRGLRLVAGPHGEPKRLAEVMIGLPTRFTSLGSDSPSAQAPPSPAPPPPTHATE